MGSGITAGSPELWSSIIFGQQSRGRIGMIPKSIRRWRSFAGTMAPWSFQQGQPCPVTKEKLKLVSSIAKTTRSRGVCSQVWRSKTCSCRIGSARWLTRAFTAQPGSKSSRCSMKWSGPNYCRCRPVCFRCLRKRHARCIATATSSCMRAYYSVPPEYVGRQVWVRWESTAGAGVQSTSGSHCRSCAG